MNKNKALILSTILCSLYIVFTEGGSPNMFTIWNLSPIFLCYFILKNSFKEKNKSSRWNSICFTLTTVGSIIYVHTAWWQNWQEIKTGSSTSAIIFIFLPIYSIILGSIIFFFSWFIGLIIKNKT